MNSFYTKIAGVTFDGRQDIIEKLNDNGKLLCGQKLKLEMEPNNPYDKNAIAVFQPDTMHKLGYIGKELAATMALKMREGIRYNAEVSQVTGGTGYSYGINIVIREEMKPVFENKDTGLRVDEEDDKIEEVNCMYSKKIYDSICSSLNECNVRFEENREEGTIAILRNRIDSSLKAVNVFVAVRESDFTLYTFPVEFLISSENLVNVGELALRVNSNYLYPQFDVNFTNQEISCKLYCDCGDRCLEKGEVLEKLLDSMNHFEKYGNAILAVSLGFQKPSEALESIKDE